MRILSIETSNRPAEIALLAGDQTRSRQSADPLGQQLIPAVESALEQVKWKISSLDLIVVSRGPGAFTGIRVGVTAAKTLAFALNCPLVAVNSLEACASVASGHWSPAAGTRMVVLMNALRGECFVGGFQIDEAGDPISLSEPALVDPQAIARIVTEYDRVVGCGLPKARDFVGDRSLNSDSFVEIRPDAATTGRLGLRKFQQGERVDPLQLCPLYLRPSYAEENR